jgi:glycosyltransferase involved in cell wall biosynthesis
MNMSDADPGWPTDGVLRQIRSRSGPDGLDGWVGGVDHVVDAHRPMWEARAPGERRAGVCQLLPRATAPDAEPLAARLIGQFQARYRHSVVYLGEPGPLADTLREAGVAVHVVLGRAGRNWDVSLRLMKVFQRERVDLVHAHQSEAFLLALIARSVYRRAAVLLTEHGRRYPDGVSAKRVAVNQVFLEPRDRAVASSHSAREALILHDGLPPEQVDVAYHGVPLPLETWPGEDRDASRRELGVDSDALLVLQPARLETGENHALAIQAFERVVRALPRARLVLAGEGPERGIVEDMVRLRRLGSHVVFAGPRIDHDRLLAAADLLLVTGNRDAVLWTLTRALAAGRPVVATRAGSVPEVVEDGICGVIAAPGDYGALAEGILRLGSCPALRKEFGRRARERAAALFVQADSAALYARIYDGMLPQ